MRNDNPSSRRMRHRSRISVRVELSPHDYEKLLRLSKRLGLSRSGVLRRGIQILESESMSPADHPAMRVVGLAASVDSGKAPYDVAHEHDRFIAETEVASWTTLKSTMRHRH